jgi:uncharacterized protein (TIRG00374 family)
MKPATKKTLGLVARIGVSLALMAYVFYTIPFFDHATLADGAELSGEILTRDVDPGRAPRDTEITMLVDGSERTFTVGDLSGEGLEWGFWPIVKHTRKSLFGASFALLFACVFITSYRWRLLMKVQGIEMGVWRAARLTWFGMFYNNVLPGLTGGDLVKMYAAARDTTRKTEAVVSVIFDRLLGIFVLGLIAAVVVLFRASEPPYDKMSLYIYAFLAAAVAGSALVLSRRIRRMLRINSILARLPFGETLRNVDRAIFLYRSKKAVLVAAMALSAANHLVIITAVFGFGLAIGIAAPYVDYLVIFPVASIISAIPTNVGGWGVGEILFRELFRQVGVAASKAVALSVLYRLSLNVFVSLPGAFLLPGKKLVSAEEMEEEIHRDLEAAPAAGADADYDPPAE